MSFGIVTVAPCINDNPTPDTRCDDPAFALSNPEICPPVPTLQVKPAVSIVCALASVQFSAIFTRNGVEEDVTTDCIWASSDTDVAVVGGASGNATGLTAGSSSISATYQGLTASTEFTVIAGEDCCEEISVSMLLVVDRTESMGQQFLGYGTKLGFAKAAAQSFISQINASKDTVGLMSFTDQGSTLHSAPTSDLSSVYSLVGSIAQSQQHTTFYDALYDAVETLAAVTADRKVIVLLSDGVDLDSSYSTDDDPIALMNTFKQNGGIVICMGVRANDQGFSLLSALSTGGFTLNAYPDPDNSTESISYLNGLRGYVCAGNCHAEGGSNAYVGKCNYSGFADWDVTAGHVDLLGNGFIDLIPGNGLYVDLSGNKSEYFGTLVSKNPIAASAGHTYRISARLAGNQRLNASFNTVRLQLFRQNTDGISDPVNAPTVGVAAGTADITPETYMYAYSYINANGETKLSPSTSVTVNHSDDVVTITADPSAFAVVTQFYRTTGSPTVTRYYAIAQADPLVGVITDSLRCSAMEAKIDTGVDQIDSTIRPKNSNLTGTPIYLINQQISINNFVSGFAEYTVSAECPVDADVWLSIKQTDAPAGGEGYGLLLDNASLYDVTDSQYVFGDASGLGAGFDYENETYIPSSCVTSYGFISGSIVLPAVDNPPGWGSTEDCLDGMINSFQSYTGSGNMAGEDVAYLISYVTAEGQTSVNQDTSLGHAVGAWIPAEAHTADSVTICWPTITDPRITAVRIWRDTTGAPLSDYFFYNHDNPAEGINTTMLSSMKLLVELGPNDGPYVDEESNAAWQLRASGESAPYENTTAATINQWSYGYQNTAGCQGYGCLSEPPPAQTSDPNPLSDPELGSVPPTECTKWAEASGSCGVDELNVESSDGTQDSSVYANSAQAHINFHTGYAPTTLLVSGIFNVGSLWKVYSSPTTTVGVLSGNLHTLTEEASGTITKLGVQAISLPAGITNRYFRFFIIYNGIPPHTSPSGWPWVGLCTMIAVKPFQTYTASASATSDKGCAIALSLAQAAAQALVDAQMTCRSAWTRSVQWPMNCPIGTHGEPVVGNGTYTSFISEQDAWDNAELLAIDDAESKLGSCDESNNQEAITILDNAAASPYPSVQYVSTPGSISSVKVNIYGLTHSYPDDVHILLVAPDGTSVLLMQNCGGANAITGVDIEFDDAAASGLPDSTIITSGSYKPTVFGAQLVFPAAQTNPTRIPSLTPYDTALSAFNSSDPVGAWTLWVMDDSAGDSGSISGWDLDITYL